MWEVPAFPESSGIAYPGPYLSAWPADAACAGEKGKAAAIRAVRENTATRDVVRARAACMKSSGSFIEWAGAERPSGRWWCRGWGHPSADGWPHPRHHHREGCDPWARTGVTTAAGAALPGHGAGMW